MDALEKNLTNDNYASYKRIKSSILSKYPNYHRNLKFSTSRGLISFTDSLLSKYAEKQEEGDFSIFPEPITRKITNISSIASSPNDAEILANVLLDFIANSEAALVNGALKFIIFSIIYISNSSINSSRLAVELALVINTFLPAGTTGSEYEAYKIVHDASLIVAEKYRTDVLVSLLSACFSYTRNLIVFFSQKFAEDRRLSGLSYKQSIATTQSLIQALADVFIKDYISTVSNVFSGFLDNYDPYYVENMNSNIHIEVSALLQNIFLSRDNFSFASSAKIIGENFLEDINNIKSNLIPDLTDFRAVVDDININFFVANKENLERSIFNLIRRF